MKKTNTLKKAAAGCLGLALTTLLVGCGDSREDFVITNNNQIAAPAAADDAFNALGNATLNQSAANGVLTNDVTNGAAISAFDPVGNNGGTIVLNADGSFTYSPVAGFVGAETFTYTLSNNAGSSTATVTLTSTGLGRFVDNTAGAGGTGTQADPFDTLAAAVAAAQQGDTIFVSRGDGTATGLTGNINLPAGVNLIGEGAGLILAQTIVPQGQAPVIDGTVTANGQNTISGLSFEGVDNAITSNGVGDLIITNNNFTGGTGTEIQIGLDDYSGSLTISNNSFFQAGDTDSTSIEITGTSNIVANDNTFGVLASGDGDGDDCIQVAANGANAEATIQANGNTFTNNAVDDLERGIVVRSANGGSATLSASGNTSQSLTSPDVEVRADGAGSQVTATITGNVSNDNTGSCFQTISSTDASVTATVVNNNCDNPTFAGVRTQSFDGSTTNVAFRDNTVTSTSMQSALFFAGNDANVCLDITGNTVNQDMAFDDDTTGTFDVERFQNANGDGLLAPVNTFNNGAGVSIGNGAPNPAAAGACQIP